MVSRNFFYITFILFIHLAGNSFAGNVRVHKEGLYSLKQLERVTLSRNNFVNAFKERVDSAENQRLEEKYSSLPKLEASYTAFPNSSELNSGDLSTKSVSRLGLSQDLVRLLEYRPAKLKESRAATKGAKEDYREAQAKAIYDLRKNYLRILSAKFSAQSYGKRTTIYESLAGIQRDRYDNTEMLLPDVIESEKLYMMAKEEQRHYTNNYRRRRILVADFTGIKESLIKDDELGEPPSLPPLDVVIVVAKKERGLTNSMLAMAELENARSKIGPKENMHLSVYGGYRTREDIQNKVTGSVETSVRFSMPIMNFISSSKSERQHLAKGKYWALNARQSQIVVKKNIVNAYEEYAIEELKLEKLKREMIKNFELLRIEEEKMNSGSMRASDNYSSVLSYKAQLERMNMEQYLSENREWEIYYRVLYLAGLKYPTVELLAKPIDDRPKALWVWKTDKFIGNIRAEYRLLRFCEKNSINKVYLSVNRRLLKNMESSKRVPSLVARFHKRKIKVSALMGDKNWVLPSKRKTLLSRVNKLINYNKKQANFFKFDGIHLDVEPYLLAGWDKDKLQILRLHRDTVREVGNLLKTRESRLRYEVDLPAFYDKISKALLSEIIKSTDAVTIMAYSGKTTDLLMKAVRVELLTASSLGKQIEIGIDVGSFPSRDALAKHELKSRAVLNLHKSFKGFALHDYKRLLSLNKVEKNQKNKK